MQDIYINIDKMLFFGLTARGSTNRPNTGI